MNVPASISHAARAALLALISIPLVAILLTSPLQAHHSEAVMSALTRLHDIKLPIPDRIELAHTEIAAFEASNDDVAAFTLKCYLLTLMCHHGGEGYETTKSEVESFVAQVADELALGKYHEYRGEEAMMKDKNLQAAIIAYQEALGYAQLANDKRTFALDLQKIAYCLTHLNALSEAVKTYERLLEFCQENGFSEFEPMAANNLASILIDLDQLDQAQAVLESVPTGASPRVDMHVYSGFTEIALKRNLPQEAIRWAEKSQSVIGESALPREQSLLNLMLAKAYCLSKEYHVAERFWELSAENIQFTLRAEDANILLGQIYLATDRESAGIKLLESALQAERIPPRIEACHALIEHYQQTDDLAQANQYLQQLNEFVTEQLSAEAAVSIELMRSRLENERKLADVRVEHQRKIKELEKEAAIERLETTAQARTRSNLIIGVATILCSTLVIGVLASLWSLRVQRRESTLKLKAAEKQKLLQQQLEQKRRLASIGMLTSSVAHDFNNLLQVFSMSTETLRDSLGTRESSEEQRAAFHSLDETVAIGSRITDQLLSFTRDNAHSVQRFELAQLLEASDVLFAAASGEEIEIVVEMLEPNLWIEVDRAGFCNAILNLLLNACDASFPGEIVKISISQPDLNAPRRSCENRISTRPSTTQPTQPYVRIDVIDHGTGMTGAELRSCLRDQFTTKLEGQGSGLGLGSVQRFVQAVNGYLEIQTLEGAGTTVSMFLPKSDSVEPKWEHPEPKHSLVRENRVAIIEDNRLVRKSLCSLLENQGFICSSFENGPSAVSEFEIDFNYQLVLTDIRMPGGMSGFDVAQWMKHHKPNTPVILISGNDQPNEEDYQFLRKPFSLESLMREVTLAMSESEQNIFDEGN